MRYRTLLNYCANVLKVNKQYAVDLQNALRFETLLLKVLRFLFRHFRIDKIVIRRVEYSIGLAFSPFRKEKLFLIPYLFIF